MAVETAVGFDSIINYNSNLKSTVGRYFASDSDHEHELDSAACACESTCAKPFVTTTNAVSTNAGVFYDCSYVLSMISLVLMFALMVASILDQSLY